MIRVKWVSDKEYEAVVNSADIKSIRDYMNKAGWHILELALLAEKKELMNDD